MSLAQFLDFLSNHPTFVLGYFLVLPLLAMALYYFTPNNRALQLKHLYSVLVFAAVIPGIFCVTLNMVLYALERRSLLDTNVITQWLPIASMFVTLIFIRKKIAFAHIPGFETIASLVWMLFATFMILWLLNKTRIYIVAFIPFWQALLLFIGLFLVIRIAWQRLIR